MGILEGIQKALQAIAEDEFIEPTSEVDYANELVIGVMPPYLRQLHTLAVRFERISLEAQQKMKGQSQEEGEKVYSRALLYGGVGDIVWRILILATITYFHLWDGRSHLTLRFRKGWQVVQTQADNVFALPVLKVDRLSSDPHAWQ